jgi:hypothetical protein
LQKDDHINRKLAEMVCKEKEWKVEALKESPANLLKFSNTNKNNHLTTAPASNPVDVSNTQHKYNNCPPSPKQINEIKPFCLDSGDAPPHRAEKPKVTS